ncbi:MAG TPA: biotin/lipoyl-containing protein [Candidatus Limnocylindrales bacterium]|jgi:biotin carboxyl carrier protein
MSEQSNGTGGAGAYVGPGGRAGGDGQAGAGVAGAAEGDAGAAARAGAVRVTFPDGSPAMAVHAGPASQVALDGEVLEARLIPLGGGRSRLETAQGARDVIVTALPSATRATDGRERVEVVVDGWRFELDVEPEYRARLRERATSARDASARGGPLELHAIIPGRVVSVDVAIGDTIDAGGRLLVIEAMKMQNELRAPRGGTISRLAVGPGQTVERGDLLLVIE